RARGILEQRSRQPARSRARGAARSESHARLHRRYARLRREARAGIHRAARRLTDAARRRAGGFDLARGGSAAACSRRCVQYSQVRLVTLGSALITPANRASPAVKVATLPSALALS